MDADLDLLLTTVFCTADDLLPDRQANAARRVTDAEVVTLCVAQAIMGIPSDRRFLAVAGKQLGHLFPELPKQPGYFKRRRRCAEALEWLLGVFASQSPGSQDTLLLIDSTPVPCAQSRETVRRSALGGAADYGWCASHSRYFWGFRLHAIFSPDGTPRALALTSPEADERDTYPFCLPHRHHPIGVRDDHTASASDIRRLLRRPPPQLTPIKTASRRRPTATTGTAAFVRGCRRSSTTRLMRTVTAPRSAE